MIHAVSAGAMTAAEFDEEPFFGLSVPQQVPNVPKEVLKPRQSWRDPEAYDRKARGLAGRFLEAFSPFEKEVPEEVRSAGPKTPSVR